MHGHTLSIPWTSDTFDCGVALHLSGAVPSRVQCNTYILLDPRRVHSTSSKRFAGSDHTAKLLRAFPVVVSVEKRKASNIASVGQGLQS